ncbi:toprim domain-containing protein [Sphingobacterium suaedae]|uniref:Toprim domain-containing protein n=1 Tax=Sphingobacterium suaedae TaxID=1686402 RepID=A0ABW5KJU5_9SPHI
MSKLINTDDFRDLSIVDFLAKLGHYPVKKSGKEVFYHSMLRDTRGITPSFTVWEEGGKWLDRGGAGSTGIQGGGIVQLGMAYWPELSFVEVLKKISEVSGIHISPRPSYGSRQDHVKERSADNYAFELVGSRPVGSNFLLTRYLESRGILDVASGRMREVYYRNRNNSDNELPPYYALGWPNDLGGWEFTTAKGFKSSIGKKSISTIPGNPGHVALFEGYVDYLSWLKINQPKVVPTVVVLNSIVQLGAAMDKIKDIPKIGIYFDNDGPGKQCADKLSSELPRAVDHSTEYRGYKDYNDRLCAEMNLSLKDDPHKGIKR